MQNDYLLNGILSKLASDSKFVGIFMIIVGALACLTCVGLPFGIPYIFAGMRAKEGGEKIEQFLMLNEGSVKISAYDSYQKHFFILKILFIVGLVAGAIALLFFFGIILSLISNLTHTRGY
jgi:hypothetical protein